MTPSSAFPRFVPPPVPLLEPRPGLASDPAAPITLVDPVALVVPVECAAGPTIEAPVPVTSAPAVRPRPDFPRPQVGRTRGAA